MIKSECGFVGDRGVYSSIIEESQRRKSKGRKSKKSEEEGKGRKGKGKGKEKERERGREREGKEKGERAVAKPARHLVMQMQIFLCL